MKRDLFDDLGCAVTGCDDPATAEFLRSAARDVGTWQVRAANAHWTAASEDLREALAPHLGLSEPSNERPPVNAGILLAYERAFEWAADLVGEPQG